MAAGDKLENRGPHHVLVREVGVWVRRFWLPLWSSADSDQDACKLPTVQEDADYASLQQYQHGDDVLLFQSLAGLVFDQLAARVERIAKEFVTVEREALGQAAPAWRYALSQDLKDKLLKTVGDDCIVESLEAHAREMSGEDAATATDTRRRGGAAVAMHERHSNEVALHTDGRGIVGYLLKLPFSSRLLYQEHGGGDAGDVEVRGTVLPLLFQGLSFYALSYCEMVAGVAAAAWALGCACS